MVSTRDLSALPAIEDLRMRMQQMAALNAVFATTLELVDPTFQYNPKWGRNSQVGAIVDGCGDELFAHFTTNGCFIKGFAHESVMTPFRTDPPALWPGLLAGVPPEFSRSLKEPAFDISATTFAVWRLVDADTWQSDQLDFPDNEYGDGSGELLSYLLMSPPQFTEWLEENYETEVDNSIVSRVFTHSPLSVADLKGLCPDSKTYDLKAAVENVGFPLLPINNNTE